MDRSGDNTPLNSIQVPYPVRNEAGKRTDVSPSQQMPLIHLPAGSPMFCPEPGSMMFQRSPVFSLFPPPTLSSSSSSLCGSSSALVENRVSSIEFNNNYSRHPTIPFTGLKHNPSLPPMIPSRRSDPLRVSGYTRPPRKNHKRSKSDTIGLNSMIPLDPPELNDPKSLEPIIGESRRGKEGVGEMKYDKELEKKINPDAFMNSDFNAFDFNAFNFNENEDEIFISNFEDENKATETGAKTGSTSSYVKRRACQESELSSKHYRSVSLDSCFNDLRKKPPLPRVNLKSKVFSTHSVHGNDIDGSASKHARRMMLNREAARRSKERKDQRIAYLVNEEMTLKEEIIILSSQLPFSEKLKTKALTENEELNNRIELMKQHLKFGDDMNKQLNAEVKRLKEVITLNGQLTTQIQQRNVARAVNEQLSVEVQQLDLTTGELMQIPNDLIMQPMNNMLEQVNFNDNQSYPYFDHSNQQI